MGNGIPAEKGVKNKASSNVFTLLYSITVQGDTSRRFKPPVDIKTKVPFCRPMY